MLKNAWAGNEPLWKVWWGLGVATCTIVMLVNAYVLYMVPLPTPYAIWIPAMVFELVLIAAWSRTAWVCAPNVKHRFWTYLARAWILLWLLSQAQRTLQHG
ncbi:hypothetical protein G3O01_09710 [Burkholderia sp. Ac-20365]|nr:hypothetical protein [Burkholderia sp. Ac-20365]MBN3761092.1 hypothetical protein [Burkholderia sp. Ac-20365]